MILRSTRARCARSKSSARARDSWSGTCSRFVAGRAEQRRRSVHAMTSRHRRQVDAREQVLECALVDQTSRIASHHWLRDPKRPGVEPLVDDTHPGAVEEQNLQCGAPPPEEYE